MLGYARLPVNQANVLYLQLYPFYAEMVVVYANDC